MKRVCSKTLDIAVDSRVQPLENVFTMSIKISQLSSKAAYRFSYVVTTEPVNNSLSSFAEGIHETRENGRLGNHIG